MCGIAGWMALADKPGSTDLLSDASASIENILNATRHRGPDGRGVWLAPDRRAILGHNRLSILDRSDVASQPMIDNEQRFVISYNGELYNYKALKRALIDEFGVHFRGDGDTEVFLYGVKHWGIGKFLLLADGMFAVAVYDVIQRRLYLARDKVGEKPLYYTLKPNGLFFASEFRPLVDATDSNPKLSLTGLNSYLALRYVIAPYCLFEGYFKISPGHYLEIAASGEKREFCYFSWDRKKLEVSPSEKNFKEVVAFTERSLVSSLHTRLASDVPVGYFLSGGLDSSILVGLTKKYIGRQISTYTIKFDRGQSEHETAEKTASICATQHHCREFSQSELEYVSREAIKKMDEPNGDRSCVPTYLLCKYVKDDVGVAISGDGGDELFGGYTRYRGLDKVLQDNIQATSRQKIITYLNQRLPVVPFFDLTRIFSRISDEFLSTLDTLAAHFLYSESTEVDVRFVDFNSYLPGSVLGKVDRMSMASSLEVRTPFFSPELLSISSALPLPFLVNGKGYRKLVLRQIAMGLGLQHILEVPKTGFGLGSDFLFHDSTSTNDRLSRALRLVSTHTREILDIDALRVAATRNANSLWAIIVLGEWLGHFHER